MSVPPKYFAPNESFELSEFPGETWNLHNRTAEQWAKFGERGSERRGLDNVTWVWVRNTTGSRVSYGGVLALNTRISSNVESAEELVFDGTAPDEADTFAIAMQAIEVNSVGRMAVAGLVRASVYIRHQEIPWVDIDPTRTDRLISHPAGRCQVLEPLSQGTHRTWVVMNHDGPSKWRCKPRKDVARDDFTPVDLYGSNPGIPIDFLPKVWLDWLTQEIVPKSAEAVCTYFRHEKRWRFTHAECSVSTTVNTYANSVGTDYTNKDGIDYDSPPTP